MARSEPAPPACIVPDWPAPGRVKAFTTTRQGGFSEGRYASFNLADHVNDDLDRVRQNRVLLRQALDLPADPLWLRQVHGDGVIHADAAVNQPPEADAAWTASAEVVCAVLTADCLPVFFTDTEGSRVAVAHGGWRGLLNGVLSSTLAAADIRPERCLAWLGPAIGPEVFEVGDEVRQAFVNRQARAAEAFSFKDPSHWLCDLYRLARTELETLGVQQIYGGNLCTFSDIDRFYSYRRDGETGRMASLIWLSGLA